MYKKSFFLLIILVVTIVLPVNAQKYSENIVNEDVIFEEADGVVAVEAEYFYKQSKTEIRRWYRTSKNELPDVRRDDDGPHIKNVGNNAYLEILPDTRVTNEDVLTGGVNFSNTAGEIAILHYKVKINTPGRYYVWVRAFSNGSEDNGIHVGIDGDWPVTGQRMQWCDGKNTWRWESKQRTEEVHCGEPYLIYLDIENTGIHEITFSMREDGFEFDRFLLTNKKEFVPEGVGPDVKTVGNIMLKTFPVVFENPANKNSFLGGVEKRLPGIYILRAANLPIEGTNFYNDKSWLAINPDQYKQASIASFI